MKPKPIGWKNQDEMIGCLVHEAMVILALGSGGSSGPTRNSNRIALKKAFKRIINR